MKLSSVLVVLDPGKATGAAVVAVYRKPAGIDINDDRVFTHRLFNKYAIKILELHTYQIDTIYTDLKILMEKTNDWASEHGSDVPVKLVGEAFIITNTAQRGASTWSLEVIGGSKALRDTQFSHWSATDYSQKSSDAKSIITNTVLKDCGVTSKNLGRKLTPHEQDAMRHALLHVARVQSKKTVW